MDILKNSINLNKIQHPSGRGSFRTEICIHLSDELEGYFNQVGNKKCGSDFYKYRNNILTDDKYISKLTEYYSNRKKYLDNRREYRNKLRNEIKKSEYIEKYGESIEFYVKDIK